ncbi:hypothetical protein MATL_G00200680 [Megalops atlanticus]|uniref:PH domain-containing protein n=1 Tax=Megalops atlanticus TaxID=7932 RepID=A0A9D3PHI9_MEGAT|nr:hypothetical protein MATL_G00200680 [Megalops atlanticus]
MHRKLRAHWSWLLAVLPASLVPPVAADQYYSVSFRRKSKRRPRGHERMSRRRVSVKELGQPDCQGWLYKKKEGKAFLGIKWKKYWFMLKKASLYWYTSQTAEKAEGYINLAGFKIDQAVECKRKHAMKAHHPQIMTFYFAAESSKEMYKWLSKLSEQVSSQDASTDGNTGECYSEASDHEEAESMMEASSNSEQATTASESLPPPSITSSPNETRGSASSPVSAVTSQNSPLANHSQSWLDISMTCCPETAETTECSMQDLPEHPLQPETRTGEGFHRPPSTLDPPVIVLSGDHPEDQVTSPSSEPKDEGCEEATSDEMEKLYIHIRQASLSPTGERKPSTKREFRSSFIKRCRNQNINEKLHLVRTLNSTLKAKEADLLTIEQVLADPSLSALKYREWKEANFLLLQEIFDRRQPLGGSVEQPVTATCIFTETSV